MMDSKSNMTLSETCWRGLRANEITVKNLADYLKLEYSSLAEEIVELERVHIKRASKIKAKVTIEK